MADDTANADWVLDDVELTRRARAASRLAIERLKAMGCPVATYDPENGTVYMLQPDGSRTDEVRAPRWFDED